MANSASRNSTAKTRSIASTGSWPETKPRSTSSWRRRSAITPRRLALEMAVGKLHQMMQRPRRSSACRDAPPSAPTSSRAPPAIRSRAHRRRAGRPDNAVIIDAASLDRPASRLITTIMNSGVASASRLTTNDTAASRASAGQSVDQIGACQDAVVSSAAGWRSTSACRPGAVSRRAARCRPSTTSSSVACSPSTDSTTSAGPPSPTHDERQSAASCGRRAREIDRVRLEAEAAGSEQEGRAVERARRAAPRGCATRPR